MRHKFRVYFVSFPVLGIGFALQCSSFLGRTGENSQASPVRQDHLLRHHSTMVFKLLDLENQDKVAAAVVVIPPEEAKTRPEEGTLLQ